jgi:hypothetical protein
VGDPVPGWIGAIGFTVLGACFVAVGLSRACHRRPVRHLTPLAIALAGYFVWRSWTCVERSRTPLRTGSPGTAPTTVPTAARTEPVTHGVISALMAAMFLSAI